MQRSCFAVGARCKVVKDKSRQGRWRVFLQPSHQHCATTAEQLGWTLSTNSCRPSPHHVLRQPRSQYTARVHEVSATEVVDRLQRDIVITEQPVAAREDPCVGCSRNDLCEAGVVGVFGVRLANEAALKPGSAS